MQINLIVNELYEELVGKKGVFKKVDLNKCASLVEQLKEIVYVAESEMNGIATSRERIMENADTVARNIIKEAEDRAKFLTSTDEILRLTEMKSREITDKAYRECDALVAKTKEHLDKMFAETETFFMNTLAVLRKNRNELRSAFVKD